MVINYYNKKGTITTMTTNENVLIEALYNGSIQSIKNVIPLEPHLESPIIGIQSNATEYGVLISFSGSFKGNLLIQMKSSVYSNLGRLLYGMELPLEMLDSFSGELGNMLAGGLSTHLATTGIHTDISHPIIINDQEKLTDFKQLLEVSVLFQDIGDMKMVFLIN